MPADPELKESRRNLPHWERAGGVYFVTFRLVSGKLAEPERQLVLDACLFWHKKKWRVEAVTVMPDHVHLLVQPLPTADGPTAAAIAPLGEIIGSVKKFSARRIQQMRGTPGRLWQDERHDHLIRDEREFFQKLDYMAYNAVNRGLCRHWREYPFFWSRYLVSEGGAPGRPDADSPDTALESGATNDP